MNEEQSNTYRIDPELEKTNKAAVANAHILAELAELEPPLKLVGEKSAEGTTITKIDVQLGKTLHQGPVWAGELTCVDRIETVQEKPHRTVALKVMRRGIASRSAMRRFHYEVQIMGRSTATIQIVPQTHIAKRVGTESVHRKKAKRPAHVPSIVERHRQPTLTVLTTPTTTEQAATLMPRQSGTATAMCLLSDNSRRLDDDEARILPSGGLL